MRFYVVQERETRVRCKNERERERERERETEREREGERERGRADSQLRPRCCVVSMFVSRSPVVAELAAAASL